MFAVTSQTYCDCEGSHCDPTEPNILELFPDYLTPTSFVMTLPVVLPELEASVSLAAV